MAHTGGAYPALRNTKRPISIYPWIGCQSIAGFTPALKGPKCSEDGRCCIRKHKEGYKIWPESFQRIEKTCRRSTFEQFQGMPLAITDFTNLSKPDFQVVLLPALAE